MNQADHISIRNFLDYLNNSRKLIIGAGFVGLFFSGIYLQISPSGYEANAIVSLAKIYNSRSGEVRYFKSSSEVIKLVEERLSLNLHSTGECPLDEVNEGVKLSPSKFSDDVILVKTMKATANLAIECARVLTDEVITTQEKLFSNATQVDRIKIEKLKHKLNLISTALSGKNFSINDLIAGQALIFELQKNIDDITQKSVLEFALYPSRLIKPISVSPVPSFFRGLSILIAGVLAGLFIGCLKFFKPLLSNILREAA